MRVQSAAMIAITNRNFVFRASFTFSQSMNPIANHSLLRDLVSIGVWRICFANRSMVDVGTMRISSLTDSWGKLLSYPKVHHILHNDHLGH